MILLIDNYDSFTYNLYQYIKELGFSCHVERNDKISIENIEKMNPDAIIISPGPGTPDKAGITIQVIKKFYKKLPILGVCLGLQAIVQSFGGQVIKAPNVCHGKQSIITHDGLGLFQSVSSECIVGRYHSLIASPKKFPESLQITAQTKDGLIMAIRHKIFPIEAVQFHPESVLTPEGHQMLLNFLKSIDV